MAKRFYNCHAHCFTYDHVPRYFLSRYVAISWVLHLKWMRELVRKAPVTGKFDFVTGVFIFLLGPFLGLNKQKVIRYLNFIRYGDRKSQEDVIKSMQAYYPGNTGYVFLTMDMEYMGAGIPNTRFEMQLKQLEAIKQKPEWKNIIYPFIFCDPRRLQPQHTRELKVENEFIGNKFQHQLKQYIIDQTYQGIKMYPALGYFPFDKRMKPVYDFALQGSVPLISHCTIGPVHFKFDLDKAEYAHPFLNRMLPKDKSIRFQQHFTHPLNFECLLNQQLLKRYWGEDAPDYTNLKICLGHWGTGQDWHDYLNNPWRETDFRKTDSKWPSLELENWFIGEHTEHNFSWFTIICNLIRKYPNVYTDISFTLRDEKLFPLLKMILEADEKIKERVLFGTDFYLVSTAICEREFAVNVRAYLGDDLFKQVAITNAERFLNNQYSKVANEFWPIEG
ncbi:MAG: hypothetical protein JWQ09_2753 [Segetibacter sp.]|nr:hypothetical protein [Segetibacter sp.]